MIANFESLLDKYAELVIKVGLNVQEKQRVWINTPIECAPFARLLLKHAYQIGAAYVHLAWNDSEASLIRYQTASMDALKQYPDWELEGMADFMRNNDARLSVYADNPDKLGSVDPEKIRLSRSVAVEKSKPIRALFNSGQGGFWAVVSASTPDWASKVFPDLAIDEAVDKLWELVFSACHVYDADPIATWKAHCENLRVRREYLTARAYKTLHYRSPETDLRVGLPDNHIWEGGADLRDGRLFVANMPTEEVFTMPHREKVEGYVTSTKPLSYAGKIMPKFTLSFEQGRVVKIEAQEHQEHLTNLLDTDEGARRLGEVAIVPHSSPISQSNVLFYNGLYDENAACHFALGNAYRTNLKNGESLSEEDYAAAGGNTSGLHMDFMMGSGDLDIDGIGADGSIEPVMRKGEWAFEL